MDRRFVMRFARPLYRALYRLRSRMLARYKSALFQWRVKDALKNGRVVCHFLKIRKTGGTALRGALGLYRRTSTHSIFCGHPHAYRLEDVPEGEKVFFVYRDPVERFVSGFNCRQRRGAPAHHYPWTPAERTAFSKFKTPNDLAEALSGPEQEDAREAMDAISHLRFPLSYWLGSLDYLRSRRPDILYCGDAKNLGFDFEHLKALFGLPDQLSLPHSAEAAHRAPAHSSTKISPTEVTNLQRWFENDYRIIDYLQTWHPAPPTS